VVRAAIEAFWRFWRESEASIEAAIEARAIEAWRDPIAERVGAIDGRLQWEFGPGRRARHYFCVSGYGDLEARVAAERWRAAGPGDGPSFEFHATRPSTGFDPSTLLRYEGTSFAMEDFRVEIERDDSRERLNLRIFHPSYAGSDPSVREGATWVALDGVLGEDEVERWIGGIERVGALPEGAGTLAALAAAVEDLRARATGERLVLLAGRLPSGAPAIATVNRALKRIDHLLLDTHYEVVVPLERPTPEGLAADGEAAELDQLEEELVELLGRDAVHIGRETREGVRVIHLHAAALGPAAARLEAWSRRLPGREVEVRGSYDPGWAILGRF